jgi:hypothetical protein
MKAKNGKNTFLIKHDRWRLSKTYILLSTFVIVVIVNISTRDKKREIERKNGRDGKVYLLLLQHHHNLVGGSATAATISSMSTGANSSSRPLSHTSIVLATPSPMTDSPTFTSLCHHSTSFPMWLRLPKTITIIIIFPFYIIINILCVTLPVPCPLSNDWTFDVVFTSRERERNYIDDIIIVYVSPC